ncbi:lipoyltransferase 1, mitochondrial-like [Sinocyclocheilus grahami]|uniref:Lipoyl amidotransferase LIPT1, mitochondrial n=1 Tax=Sinocyclocheilus grahami TaxID=75366 RepID=A0A672P9Y7_SINGR|nr:PREDICTED: lipoyltransferase 1, mitochondrial-like [Sinocyclocheilus grahami]
MILRLSNRACVLSGSARLKSTLSTFFDEMGKAGVILKSASTGIFENLALEDWIHDRVDLQNRSVLLLWRNSPVVVIGRHQNPWQECNLPLMRRLGIPLARRRSGGGTVFHDFGNINMTFFTSKKKYDRHRNLKVVTSALKTLRPDLDVAATDRFDILLNGHHKISGTAAKLGRTSAYHHCTLLCSVDRSVLSSVLKSNTSEVIKSNATPSVPSPVRNLLDVDPTLDSNTIMDAIASQYNNEFGFDSPVITVDPTHEGLMPGIHKMAQDLQPWEWIYGRTPKFSVCTSLVVDDVNIKLDMAIKNGAVEQCAMEIPEDWLPSEMVNEFTSTLNGSKYCPSEAAVLVAAFMRTHSMTDDVAEKIHRLCAGVVSVM